MYRYRRHGCGFGCLPLLIGLLVLMVFFSGPSHHLWFFIWPLFFGFPLLIAAGLAFLFVTRRWHYLQGKHKNSETIFGEKAKRGHDTDIFYV